MAHDRAAARVRRPRTRAPRRSIADAAAGCRTSRREARQDRGRARATARARAPPLSRERLRARLRGAVPVLERLLVAAARRRAIRRAAAARAPRRRRVRARRVLAQARRAGTARRATSGPCCDALDARAPRAAAARRRRARGPTSAPGAGGSGATEHRRTRAAVHADRAARLARAPAAVAPRCGAARSAEHSRAMRASDDLRAARGRRRAATCGRCSRGQLGASPGCSSRGRRAPWTRRPRRSTRSTPSAVAHLRRGRRLGTRADARGAAARHPSVGLQHGFIYRHWLNYRHAPDEMQPSPANPGDRGFPRPDRTLLFDGYARQHLETAGRVPARQSSS